MLVSLCGWLLCWSTWGFFPPSWILLSVDTVRIEGCVCLCFLAQSHTKKYNFLLNWPLNTICVFWDIGWGGRTQQVSALGLCIHCSNCKRKLLMYNGRKKTSTLNKVYASFLFWSLALWTMVVLVSVGFLPSNAEVQVLKRWLLGFC